MKKNQKLSLLIVIISIVIGIFVYKWINLPPGCKDTGLIMGGCFSKQNVENVKIDNPTDCLNIQISNCLSPKIEIDNRCNKTYTVEGVEYESGYNYIDLEEGKFFIEGEIEEQKFSISGYVTKPLCN